MTPTALHPRGSLLPIAAAVFACCSALPSAPVASAAAPPARTVAGMWDSSFGAVTLEQDPPSPASTMAVRGFHDESPGRRAEIRDGRFDPTTGVLEFTYFQAWRKLTGTGRFTLSSDNSVLTGTYRQPDGSGGWTLTRRGGSPMTAAPAPAAATGAVPSVAGRWSSKLGPVTLQHAASSGSGPVAVTGFHDESREHRAELRDGTFDPASGALVFTYHQPWRNVTGTGRFVLSADGRTLTGTYSQPGASGSWTLERIAETVPAAAAAVAPKGTSAPGTGTQLAIALAGVLFGPKDQPPASPAAVHPSATSTPPPQQSVGTMPAGVRFGETPPRASAVSDTQTLPTLPPPGTITDIPGVPRTGLVGEWLFAGETADTSGRGFNGKVTGGATAASDRFGREGMALRFNGTNAKLDCGTLPGINLTQQATLSLWVKLEGRPGYWHIAGKSGNGTDLDLIVDGGAVRFYIAGGANYTTRRKLAEGEWTHVAASFQAGGKLKIYLNGELDGAIDIGARGENGNPFTIGESGVWGGRWFKGILDDIRLYDRQLSDAEVRALSRERAGAVAPATAPAAVNHFERGKALLAAGDYRGAVDAFGKAIGQNPSHAEAYRERARSHNRLLDFRAGLADAERAIALNPNDAVAVNLRGNARSRLGDTAGAIADYSQAIKLDPKYASPLANRGALRLAAKDYGAARRDYDQALAIAPRDENSLWGRGDVKARTGDLAGALADYDRALAVNPRNAGILNNRGQALYQNGKYAEAMESLNQALLINPRHANALANRGATRARLGDAAGGRADLEEALRLEPSNTLAQGALAAMAGQPGGTPRPAPTAVAAATSPSSPPKAEPQPVAPPVVAPTSPRTEAPAVLAASASAAATSRPPADRFPNVDQSSLTAPLRAALLGSPALAVREQRGAILFRPTGDLHVVSEGPAPGGSRKLEILADGERRASADASVQKTSMRLLAVVDPDGKGIEVTSAATAGPEDDELIRLLEARR